MGLLDMVGYGDSPFGQFVDQNRYKLGALGAGLAGGTTLGGGLALGTQYMQQAQLLDAQRRQQQTDEQKRKSQLNQTMKWMQAQAASDPFYADLVNAVETEALSPAKAWEMALTRRYEQPGNDLFGTPVYIQKPDGSTGVAQLGKDGKYHEVDTPEGINVLTPTTSVDYGTGTKILNRGGGTVADVPKDLSGAERDKAAGKEQGAAIASYNSIASKMPGLEQTVAKLDELSEQATYTVAGQVIDEGMRQAGMEPREAAIARAQYIAIVDNQILPLLRDTFGAQFTEREGQSLKATLGDPNKSPKEKQAVLKAFIEQKRRDVEALAAQAGLAQPQMQAQPQQPQMAPAGGVVDYQDFFK